MRSFLFLFTLVAVALRAANPEPLPAPEYEWQSRTPPPAPAPAPLRVNSIGFSPAARKCATAIGKEQRFTIVDLATDQAVLTGVSAKTFVTAETDTAGEVLSVIDFSSLRTPGRYAINVTGLGRSAPFVIGDRVWNEAYRIVARGMYLWRWRGG